MAASLVKMMSGLCLSEQVGVSNIPKLLRHMSPIMMTSKNQNKSYSALQSEKQLWPTGLQNNSEQFRVLKCKPGLSIAVRSVTYEIKQWREHRVINRFYRLHWGGWIRTRGGRFRKLYRKTPKVRWSLQQHIFCNRTQNRRLDRLILPHWKEPKHFVDSPYEPYHQRTNFPDFPNHRKFYP